MDGGAELFELERKVGVLHLAGQRLAQRRPEPARRIEIPFISGPEEGGKEGQPLDVVPMGMADQNMAFDRLLERREFLSEREGAGAHVQHDERSGP